MVYRQLMKCYDLFKLPSLNQLEIVAGVEGISNDIRWIYFADAVSIDDCCTWIEGQELVITTGNSIAQNPDKMIPVLSQLAQKQIAGIMFNVGNFITSLPDELIQEADRLHIPMFTLPWQSKLITASHEICNQIIMDEEKSAKTINFLDSILFNPELKNTELSQIILNSDFDFKNSCRIGVLQYNVAGDVRSHLGGRQQVTIESLLLRSFRNQIENRHMKIVFTIHDRHLVFIGAAQVIEGRSFADMVEEVRQSLLQRFPDLHLFCGIGRAYNQPFDYKKSYEEGLKAGAVVASAANGRWVSFYDRADIMSLLSYVSDTALLKDFYYAQVGKILEYDNLHDSHLLETLHVFINHNMDFTTTADILYLHKNTLRYRIGKIESLLGESLNDLRVINNQVIAEKIGILLHINT